MLLYHGWVVTINYHMLWVISLEVCDPEVCVCSTSLPSTPACAIDVMWYLVKCRFKVHNDKVYPDSNIVSAAKLEGDFSCFTWFAPILSHQLCYGIIKCFLYMWLTHNYIIIYSYTSLINGPVKSLGQVDDLLCWHLVYW